jgi:hypothetical protein
VVQAISAVAAQDGQRYFSGEVKEILGREVQAVVHHTQTQIAQM